MTIFPLQPTIPLSSAPVHNPGRPAAPPPKVQEISKAVKPLDNVQMERMRRIVDPERVCKIVPLAQEFSDRPIQFRPMEFVQFLTDALTKKGVINQLPSITGGSACHILTGLEYADIDINFYIHSEAHFDHVLTLFQKYLGWKLGYIPSDPKNPQAPPANLADLPLPKSDANHIKSIYLFKKTIVEGKFSYFGLGDFEFKFIIKENNPRCHVSTSDSFHIPMSFTDIGKPVVPYSTESDYEAALNALRHREMVVRNPDKVDFLIYRVLHKKTQGFDIISDPSVDMIQTALCEMMVKYPHDKLDKLVQFKSKFDQHLKNHYRPENEAGKMIGCLNFLCLLQHIANKEARNAYIRCVAATFKTMNCSYLKQFLALIDSQPEDLQDLLAFVRGIYLLEWVNGNSAISAYAFEFARRKDSPRMHFSFSHGHERQFLIAPDHPGRIAADFLASWRALEERFAKEGKADVLGTIAKDVGLGGLVLSPATRPIVAKTLLDRYGRSSMAAVLTEQFAGSIPPGPFCQAVRNEVEILRKECVGTLDPNYFDHRICQYQLKFLFALEKKRNNTHAADLIQAILQPMTRYPAAPSKKDLVKISEALKKASAQPLIASDKILIPLLFDALKEIFRAVKSDSGWEVIETAQATLLQLEGLPIFTPGDKRALVGLLLGTSLPKISPISPEAVLSSQKFLQELATWQNCPPELEKQIAEARAGLRPLLIEAAVALAKIESTDLALQCMADGMNGEGINDVPGACDTALVLTALAVNANTAFTLRMAADITLKAFRGRSVVAKSSEQLLLLVKQLFQIKGDLCEDGKKASDYTGFGYRVLCFLAENSLAPDTVRTFLLKRLASIIATDSSPADIQKLFQKFCGIIQHFPDKIREKLDPLNAIAANITPHYHQAFKDFVLFVSQIDSSLARSFMSNQKFAKELPDNARKQVVWDLIDTQVQSKDSGQIEQACTAWESESHNFSLRETICSIHLILALYAHCPKSADAWGDKIIAALIPILKEFRREEYQNEKEIGHLETALQLFIKKRYASATPQAFRQIEIVAKACCEGGLITKTKLLEIIQLLIKKHLEAKKLLPETLVMSFLETANQLKEAAKPIDMIAQIIEACLQHNVTAAHMLAWKMGTILIKQQVWNDKLSGFFTKFLITAPANGDSKACLEVQGVFCNALFEGKKISLLTSDFRTSILQHLLKNKDYDLCLSFWTALFETDLKMEIYSACIVILTSCLVNVNLQSLLLIRKSIISYKILTDPDFPDTSRATAYSSLLEYFMQLHHRTKEPQLCSEYLQQVEAHLIEANQTVKKENEFVLTSYVSNVIAIYVVQNTAKSLEQACKLLQQMRLLGQAHLHMIKMLLSACAKLPQKAISDELTSALKTLLNSQLLSLLDQIKDRKVETNLLTFLEELLATQNHQFDAIYHLILKIYFQFKIKERIVQPNVVPEASDNEETLSLQCRILVRAHQHFCINGVSKALNPKELELLVKRYFTFTQTTRYQTLLLQGLILPIYRDVEKFASDDSSKLVPKIETIEYLLHICPLKRIARNLITSTCKVAKSRSIKNIRRLSHIFLNPKVLGYDCFEFTSGTYQELDEMRKARFEVTVNLLSAHCRFSDFSSYNTCLKLLDFLSETIDWKHASKDERDNYFHAVRWVHDLTLIGSLHFEDEQRYSKFLALFSKIYLQAMDSSNNNDNGENPNAQHLQPLIKKILNSIVFAHTLSCMIAFSIKEAYGNHKIVFTESAKASIATMVKKMYEKAKMDDSLLKQVTMERINAAMNWDTYDYDLIDHYWNVLVAAENLKKFQEKTNSRRIYRLGEIIVECLQNLADKDAAKTSVDKSVPMIIPFVSQALYHNIWRTCMQSSTVDDVLCLEYRTKLQNFVRDYSKKLGDRLEALSSQMRSMFPEAFSSK